VQRAEEIFMIRKLKSGKYRLYSRKKDTRTSKRKNLGTFNSEAAAKKHELRFSISSATRIALGIL
jgi:hypothetical protein